MLTITQVGTMPPGLGLVESREEGGTRGTNGARKSRENKEPTGTIGVTTREPTAAAGVTQGRRTRGM